MRNRGQEEEKGKKKGMGQGGMVKIIPAPGGRVKNMTILPFEVDQLSQHIIDGGDNF